MAPNLFFRLISCYCFFDRSSNLISETNLFVEAEGFSPFVGLFLTPNALLLLGSNIQLKWQFSSHSYGKNEKFCASKPVKIFHHIFDRAHNQGHTQCECSIWSRFAKILCLSNRCVKFQPSQCIFTLSFDHFPSSFNFERGVTQLLSFSCLNS